MEATNQVNIKTEEQTQQIKVAQDKLNRLTSTLDNKDWKNLETETGFSSVYFDEESGHRSLKSTTTISANIKTVFSILQKVDLRHKYIKMIKSAEIVDRIDDDYYITHMVFKGVWPIQDRDFVSINHEYLSPSESEGFIFQTAIDSKKMPEIKGNVRGELFYGVYMLKRIDEETTHIINISCTDVKISSLIVNLALKDAARGVLRLKDLIENNTY